METSGVSRLLEYEVDINGSVKLEMPFIKSVASKLNEYIVWFEGINHIVILDMENKFIKLDEQKFKEFASTKLQEYKMFELQAAGICVYDLETKIARFAVWVREQNTLFNETSCGSGSSAIGAVVAVITNQYKNIEVIQPSGEIVTVETILENDNLKKIYIKGAVETLYDGPFEMNKSYENDLLYLELEKNMVKYSDLVNVPIRENDDRYVDIKEESIKDGREIF